MAKRVWVWLGIGFMVLVVGLMLGSWLLGWLTPDAGAMTYCASEAEPQRHYRYTYTGDGPRDIDEREGCPKNEVVRLSGGAPFSVAATGLSKREDDVLRMSLSDFNEMVGCVVLLWQPDDLNARVRVWREAKTVGSDEQEAEVSHYMLDNFEVHAHLTLRNIPIDAELNRALVHEMGHAAGLAHDAFKASAMYPFGDGAFYLTEDDVELLHSWYCK